MDIRAKNSNFALIKQTTMIKYLIVEDERLAYSELKRMMQKYRPDYELAGWAQSVEQAVLSLKQGGIDLLLLDIRLSDGLSFDIFNQVAVDIPVIFTTAYDEYAIKAFKVNGIDYLLKPLDDDELEAALLRFERHQLANGNSPQIRKMEAGYATTGNKDRFMIQIGDTYKSVPTSDVAYFMSEDKYTYLYLFSGKSAIVDYSLDQLERLLDTRHFFRVSRKCIANISAVEKSTRYFGGRLKLYLKPEAPCEVMISRSRAAEFLKWIDGEV